MRTSDEMPVRCEASCTVHTRLHTHSHPWAVSRPSNSMVLEDWRKPENLKENLTEEKKSPRIWRYTGPNAGEFTPEGSLVHYHYLSGMFTPTIACIYCIYLFFSSHVETQTESKPISGSNQGSKLWGSNVTCNAPTTLLSNKVPDQAKTHIFWRKESSFFSFWD